MENKQTRIEFYCQRSFSDKLNATFDFIRENYKPLLKYSFYLIMPICLVQAYSMNSFISSYIDMITSQRFLSGVTSWASNYGLTMLCQFLGAVVISGLVYALMQTYSVRENRLQDVVYGDFKEALARNIGKHLIVVFAAIVAFMAMFMFVIAVAVYLSKWSLLLTIPMALCMILCLIPLMLLVPVYIFERDITFGRAIQKALRLGMATLGGLLGLMIVLSILSSVIGAVITLPWYIATVLKTIFFGDDSSVTHSVAYKFMLYLFGLIQAYGSCLASIISIVGLAFHYFHAREKIEGVRIESNITNFKNL
jgi:hypothetical protein